MELMITVLDLIAVLSVLVFAHELGHFLVAKWCGMHVEDFSLFFGPRLLRIGKFNGTEYNIRSVPLGGFVKIAGMEPDDLVLGADLMRPSLAHGKPVALYGLSENDVANLNADNIGDRVRAIAETAVAEGERKRLSAEGKEELKALLLSTSINTEEHKYIETILKADAYEPDPRGYNQRPLWQRAATIFAGPFASLLFALLVFIVMGFTTGMPYAQSADNTIGAIRDPKGPAARAGLRKGDRVLQINDTPIHDGEGMVGLIRSSAGKPLTFKLQRGASIVSTTVTPELTAIDEIDHGKQVKKQVGLIGVMPGTLLLFRTYSPVESVRVGWDVFTRNITGMLGMIFSKNVAKNTGGIIAIGSAISEDSKAGIRSVLFRAASLSISLGIVNLFPIPVLDGGHLLLLGWEGIRRRKLTSREVVTAQLCGLSIIGVLFVLITYKDFVQEVLPHLKHG
jgi:regulator of sigma E protease